MSNSTNGKFKPGDKVRIVKCSGEDVWYKNSIGELYTIDTNTTTLHERKYWYIVERPNHTIFVDDIELELVVQEPITTIDAVNLLQSLLTSYSDAQIVLSETEMFVNALDKTFICENVEVLEEVCKAVSYLTRQELD